MIVDASRGDRGRFIDRDTGSEILWVEWADTETGELVRFAPWPPEVDPATKDARRIREKRRFQFFRKGTDLQEGTP